MSNPIAGHGKCHPQGQGSRVGLHKYKKLYPETIRHWGHYTANFLWDTLSLCSKASHRAFRSLCLSLTLLTSVSGSLSSTLSSLVCIISHLFFCFVSLHPHYTRLRTENLQASLSFPHCPASLKKPGSQTITPYMMLSGVSLSYCSPP